MDKTTAENIRKTASALKSCERFLEKVDKKGSAILKLNCTGIEIVVHKNDAVYATLQREKYSLLCKINSYEVSIVNPTQTPTIRRTAPAPVGASANTTKKRTSKNN